MSMDLPGWVQQAGTLLGAGTVGAVLLRLIDKGFGRAKEEDSNRAQRRAELTTQIANLTTRVDVLTERLDKERDRNNKLVEECADLRAENRALRGRYHELRATLAIVVGSNELMRHQLGLPPQAGPELPDWVYSPVPGPTEQQHPQEPKA